ncbi:MAG: hypothetical protein ABJN26_25975 [Stappiaceae bacterium]
MRLFSIYLLTAFLSVLVPSTSFAQISPADEAQMMAEIDQAEAALEKLRQARQEVWSRRPETLGEEASLRAERDAAAVDVDALRGAYEEVAVRLERVKFSLDNARDRFSDARYIGPPEGASAKQLGEYSARMTALQKKEVALKTDYDATFEEWRAALSALRAAETGIRPLDNAASQALQDRTAWEPEYRAANYAVIDARAALEKARNRALLALRKNKPPILLRVETPEVGETGYRAEWTGGQEQALARLRMAQFLHLELSQTVRVRDERLRRMRLDVIYAEDDAKRKKEYFETQYNLNPLQSIGDAGDYIYASITTGEGEEWEGPAAFPFPQGWSKLLQTAVGSTFNDVLGAKSPAEALVNVSVNFIGRLWDGSIGNSNPQWDVTKLSNVNIRNKDEHDLVTAAGGRIYARATATAVREAVEGMAEIHGGLLARDDFEAALFEAKGPHTLGSDLELRFILEDQADFKLMADPSMRAFTTPHDVSVDPDQSRAVAESMVKSLIRDMLSEGWPDHFQKLSVKGSVGDLFKAYISEIARAKTDEVLLTSEMALWADYVGATYDLAVLEAQLDYEIRYRNLELRLIRHLDQAVLPVFVEDLKRERSQRKLVSSRTLGLVGKNAELILTFSRPVTVTEVTINDQAATIEGEGTTWRATFPLRPIWASASDGLNAKAELRVDAHLANFPDVTLDDPESILTYEAPPTDPPHHVMRLFPETFQPSFGGMGRLAGDAHKVLVQAVGLAFVDKTAWVGVLPEGAPELVGRNARDVAVQTVTVGAGHPASFELQPLPVGGYSIRLFESADGTELSRHKIRVCPQADIGSSRCLVE